MNNESNTVYVSGETKNTNKKLRKTAPKKNSAKKNCFCALVMVVLSIIVAAGASILVSQTLKKAAESTINAYSTSKDAKEKEIFAEYYKEAFDKAEKKYHTKNRATISIESIKELNKLVVLSVSDVEYVIDEESNYWLEVNGEGVFAVDMSLSEVVTDQSNSYVLVRVPFPVLSDVKISSSKPLLLTKEGLVDGNNSEGTKQAMEMLDEGYENLETYMGTSRYFYETAKSNAESVIAALVKECNPDIPDLNVLVEFFDS